MPVRDALNIARDVVKKYSTRSAIENGSPTGRGLFQIDSLRHEHAFTSEHDDVGLDPLRVRAHTHD